MMVLVARALELENIARVMELDDIVLSGFVVRNRGHQVSKQVKAR